MEIQNREAYEQIFFTEESKKIFPLARYMMQLEDVKDEAIKFLDKVNKTEYPFIYTDYAKPELTIQGGHMLINAVVAEAAGAEHEFRSTLLEIIRNTRHLQRKYFGYEFLDDSNLAGKIVRNLKDRFYGDPLEDTDEDILEKIIFTIDLGHWCSDFFCDDSEEESEGSWLSSILEDLTEDEPGQRSKRVNRLRPELS